MTRAVKWDEDDERTGRLDAAGRALVTCDETCDAYEEPGSDRRELAEALRHWKSHSWIAGCSHGR